MVTEQQVPGADEMYCSSCSKVVKKQAMICVHCGVPIHGAVIQRRGSAGMVTEQQVSGGDEMYCSSCGKVVKKQAVNCVHCGVPIHGAVIQQRVASKGKSKRASVLLAVFLGTWTWLYTYKRDGWKFWVGLGLSLVAVGFVWLPPVFFIISFGLWVWAIVDTAVKRPDWYVNY